MSKLLRYQLWHLCLLCPPSPRKIRRENNHHFSTCEQDPCLLSICHDTQGKLSGRSCPAQQVFSLWEQLNRADKTTIKNFHSWGSADSSSWGTRTAPSVCYLDSSLPMTHLASQFLVQEVSASTSLSQTPHGGTGQPAVRKSAAKQGNYVTYSSFQASIRPLKLIFAQLSFETVLIQGNVSTRVWLGLWLWPQWGWAAPGTATWLEV